jgi:MinD superfamily P-loop ATPase
VRACPTTALALQDGRAIVAHPLACEYIGMCEMVCPTRAITRPFEIVFPEAAEDPSNSTKVVGKN